MKIPKKVVIGITTLVCNVISDFQEFTKFEVSRRLDALLEKCPNTELFLVRIFSVFGPEVTPYLVTFHGVTIRFYFFSIKVKTELGNFEHLIYNLLKWSDAF